MRPIALVLALVASLNAPDAFAAAPDRGALDRARRAYNEGRYDAAIGAARHRSDVPDQVDAARLVLARALLERYRDSRRPARPRRSARHAARDRLPAPAAGERYELLVGFGQWLFLTGRFGAAAELFETALGSRRPRRSPAATACSTGGRARSTGRCRKATATRPRSTAGCSRGWNRRRGTSPRLPRPVTGLPPPRAGWASSIARGRPPWPRGCGPA